MILETKDLNAGYGDIQILWDINIKIGEGEIVALAGSNGAGKSTLLRSLIGLLKPMSGDVFFKGRSISDYESQDRVKLGVSFQSSPMDLDLVKPDTMAALKVMRRPPKWSV